MNNNNEKYLQEFLSTKSKSSRPQYNSSIKRLFSFIDNQDIETIKSNQLNEFLDSCKANKNYITSFMVFIYSKPENARRENWDIIKWCVPIEFKELIKF